MHPTEKMLVSDVVATAREGRPIARARRVSLRAVDTLGLPAFVVALLVIFAIIEPRFASFSNAQNVARQMADLLILACAQTFVILVGGIDVSIGSIIGGASVTTAFLVQQFGLVGMVGGIVFGALVGVLNGVLIAKLRVAPFVITLGMLTAVRGWALFVTGGEPVFGRLPKGFLWLGAAYVGPVPVPTIVALLVFSLTWVILAFAPAGRYLYAIGGNREAARLSGINVARYEWAAYVICGALAGLAGVVLSSRVNSGQPNLGEMAELDAIAAVVIGGVALGGGRGNVLGVFFGVLLLGILRNGLNLANVSSYTQLMLIGLVVITAIIADRLRHRRFD